MIRRMTMRMIERPSKFSLAATPLSAFAVIMLAITPLAPASGMMSLSVCGADGVTRTINIPVDREEKGGDDCVKACHGFCSRKQAPEDRSDTDD